MIPPAPVCCERGPVSWYTASHSDISSDMRPCIDRTPKIFISRLRILSDGNTAVSCHVWWDYAWSNVSLRSILLFNFPLKPYAQADNTVMLLYVNGQIWAGDIVSRHAPGTCWSQAYDAGPDQRSPGTRGINWSELRAMRAMRRL